MKTETIAAIASAMTYLIRYTGHKKETSYYHSARVIRFIMAIFMMKMK